MSSKLHTLSGLCSPQKRLGFVSTVVSMLYKQCMMYKHSDSAQRSHEYNQMA